MDPNTAFQTAAGVVAIVELIAKILKRFGEYRQARDNVPKCLQSLATQLPYLRKLFELRLGSEPGAQLTSTIQERADIIEDCKSTLERLEDILGDLTAEPSDGNLEKMRKAIISTRREKKIGSIQSDLDRQIRILTYGSSIECQMALATLKRPEASRSTSLQKSYGFPSTKVSKFIGREALLEEIELRLAADSTERQVIVLCGMGGSGKTQIALELCNRKHIRENFLTIFWVDANSEASTRQSFECFADSLGQSDSEVRESKSRLGLIKAVIEELQEPSLLIFDNYDSPSKFQTLRTYFPRNPRHGIIITTRHSDCSHLGDIIPIPAMDAEDAVELLMHKSGPKPESDGIEQGQIIVSRLGNLPLAIAQAGAFIRSRKLPFHEFLGHYNRRRSFILNDKPDVWEYGLTVFTTWEISLEQVSEDALHRKEIQQFLVLSVLLYQGTVIQSRFECLRERSSSLIDWAEIFCTNGRWDSDQFREVISKLDRLSIVKMLNSENGQCEFTMHPMVCDWLRVRNHSLSPTEYLTWAMNIVTAFMNSPFLQTSEGHLGRESELYIQSWLHNFSEMKNILNIDFLRSESLLDFKLCCATHISRLGRPKLGTIIYEECLEDLGEDFGPKNQRFAYVMNNLGSNYAADKKFADAERVFRLAIAAYSSYHAYVNLGTCLLSQGKCEEAQEMFEQAFEWCKINLGLYYPDTVNCQANLAAMFYSQGQTAKSAEMLKHVSDILETDIDPSSKAPIVMSVTYLVLGRVYSDMADYDNAEKMYQCALDALTSMYGLECLRALPILEELGQVLGKKDHMDQCELMYEKAFLCSGILNGSDHETTLYLHARYADILFVREKYLEARTAASGIFDTCTKIHGYAHEQTVRSYFRLHTILYRLGEYARMEKMCRELLLNCEMILGHKHIFSRLLACRLGWSLAHQDQYDEAECVFRQVIQSGEESGEESASSSDVLTLHAMGRLARVLRAQNRLPEAEAVYKDQLCINTAVSGPEAEDTIVCMATLSHCLLRQYKIEEATPYVDRMQQAIAGRSDMSIDTVKAVARLAKSLPRWSKDRRDKTAPGAKHPDHTCFHCHVRSHATSADSNTPG